MKKKPTNKNQLTLNLTFDDPTPAVINSLAVLVEIANKAVNPGPKATSRKTPEVPPQAAGNKSADTKNPSVKRENKPLRAQLRQLAGCVTIATKQDWHTVWVLAYDQFFKLTGVHPVVESVRAKLPTHLDYVFTNPEWPDILHAVFEGMLTKP